MTVALFAGVRVRVVTAVRAWYERLLGAPSFFPNATEVVWTLADDRSARNRVASRVKSLSLETMTKPSRFPA